MDAELAAFEDVGAGTRYSELDRVLRASGWTVSGVGDWARVLGSPSRRWAARISPFDPAAPYTAEVYSAAAATGRVPILALHRLLAGGADLTVLEHLVAVPEDEAETFHRAIADDEPEVSELTAVVRRVHERAASEQPWWGPVDTNPENVMRTADGRLVLTDPFYADGPALYAAARDDPDRVVRLIPRDRREHLCEIPVATSGPWADEYRERLRVGIAAADERAV